MSSEPSVEIINDQESSLMVEASVEEENANLASTISAAYDEDYRPKTRGEALMQDNFVVMSHIPMSVP